MGKKLGMDTAGTADPNQLKGNYVLYNAMVSNKSLRKGGGKGDVPSYDFFPSNWASSNMLAVYIYY